MESEGTYTHVTFSDGSRHCVSYCQTELERRFRLGLTRVNRQVSAKKEFVKVFDDGVKLSRKKYKFSRRMKVNWLILLIFCGITATAQNNAPTAKNDTLKVCNDVVTSFSVLSNDFDIDGDRIMLRAFSNPSNIDIVAIGNTGNFRLNATGDVGTFNFGYTIRDLKFANIGSKTSSAIVYIITSSPYIYSGNYTTTNNRTACRSSTSGVVTISNGARETMIVDTYGELLPGTTITASGGGVFELKPKK